MRLLLGLLDPRVNLNPSSGYPPADHSVRGYLASAFSQSDTYDRVNNFLEALFKLTAETLPDPKSLLDYVGFARRFRSLMTEGQNMMGNNLFRKRFYERVIEKAYESRLAMVRNIRMRPYP